VSTVSVVTLAALTAYIVAGLLTLARVPDPGGPARRLVELALWPAVAVRTAASPSRRNARPEAEVVPSAVGPQEWQAAATLPPGAPLPAATAQPLAPEASASPPATLAAGPVDEPAQLTPAPSQPSQPSQPAPAAPATTAPPPPPPDAVPEPAPRDVRSDWERFVLRLTELSD
jgi:hypothetical protein